MAASTWYVDADSPPAGDGLTWETGFRFINDALVLAVSGDEIHVAQGTYRPDEREAFPTGTGVRTATFQLKSGVQLMGGFAGMGEVDPDARSMGTYETILSGDLLENDGPFFANNADNSYHVVSGSPLGPADGVLDGFTITAGNANGAADLGVGGGFFGGESQGEVRSCRFEWNAAVGGAGMYIRNAIYTVADNTYVNNTMVSTFGAGLACRTSSATITDCVFEENLAVGGPVAWSGGGGMRLSGGTYTVEDCLIARNEAVGDFALLTGMGAGAYVAPDTAVTFRRCIFEENYAHGTQRWGGAGGGMYAHQADVTMVDTQFLRNTASSTYAGSGGYGGGHVSAGGTLLAHNCQFIENVSEGVFAGGAGMNLSQTFEGTIANTLFVGNSAEENGGAIGIVGSGAYGVPVVTVANCTLTGNTSEAGIGAGIYLHNGGDIAVATVANTILWDDFPDEIASTGVVTLDVQYSDIEGGWPGLNLDVDPLFVDPENSDYRLIAPSPCVDAADNDRVPPDLLDLDDDGDTVEPLPIDLDGNPRFVDAPAADTGHGVPPIADMGAFELACATDIDGDGITGFQDLLEILARWGACPGCPEDIDGDGIVGFQDLLLVLAEWGACD
jgi:hypothetical protein